MASVALMSTSGPDERPRVLIVDDEKFIRDILADFLGMEGYIVRTAEDGAAALTELDNAHYDLVISDLKMPRMGGIELLDAIGTAAPSALTVIMTGFGTVETAIDAMKRGAYDYILKPFKVEEVIRVVQRGLEKQRLAAENLRLREAVSLYKVSEAIAASLSLEEVLATIGDTAVHELEGDLVSTWLDDGEGGYFERQRLVQPPGRDSSLPPTRVSEPPIAGERRRSRWPTPSEPRIGAEFGELAPRAFIDHYAAHSTLLEQGAKGARFFAHAAGGAARCSLVSVPLRMKTRLLGWICVASFTKQKRFNEGQRKLLSIVGSRAAAAIENARLYEDLRATFQQTIQGLARAIDKMDRYTAGHSERVATYATYLAVRLGLPPDVVEIVRQSALMHDIGKIGCVMNLNKPGKLTQDEYEIFKKHPAYGKDILDPIKFLHPLVPGVHLHHERWDGRGYPLGLKGNDVPLIARIIAVADTYDAMTSDRAYRRALPHEVAVGEIERCSGSQFDPEVAYSFTAGLDEFREELAAKGDQGPGLRALGFAAATVHRAIQCHARRQAPRVPDVRRRPARPRLQRGAPQGRRREDPALPRARAQHPAPLAPRWTRSPRAAPPSRWRARAGIGILHKNLPIEAQAREVERVKRAESGMILGPVTVRPSQSLRDALEVMREHDISGVPVVEGERPVGILTARDIRFEQNLDQPVSALMTKELVTVPPGRQRRRGQAPPPQAPHREAPRRRRRGQASSGLITIKDILQADKYPQAVKDEQRRLRVGAAIGPGPDRRERTAALVAAGVDVLVIDTAHGHSRGRPRRGARDEEGVPGDARHRGQRGHGRGHRGAHRRRGRRRSRSASGPGSICTTRVVAGVGVPQISAVADCARVGRAPRRARSSPTAA